MSKATTAIIVGIAAIGLITFVSSQANGQAQDVLVTDHDSELPLLSLLLR